MECCASGRDQPADDEFCPSCLKIRGPPHPSDRRLQMNSEPISPLRQRMIEDMTIRQLGPKTQHGYVRVVRDFTRFLGRSADLAEPEDLRRYQLHLASLGASPGKMNAAVSALRFFFKVTLDRPVFGDRLATVD